ncbi:MAG: hypothetical protein IJR82_05320 [Bacilli bacterium]|nr:hypothetical protein [Bacilli bacterium]
MKVTTNFTHKSFKTKENIKQKAKRTIQRIGALVSISGLIINCSGCSDNNSKTETPLEIHTRMNQAVVDMYESETLSSQSLGSIEMYYAKIGNDFIDNLPKDLKMLGLYNDMYITDLSNLPNVCTSLQTLIIENCHSIINFEFIKELKNLQEFTVYGDAVGITEDLIAYLDSQGIKHNLDNRLVNLNNQIDNIVDEIISDDMDEYEKMNTIASYVLNNLMYDYATLNDESLATEYNHNPLESALNGLGVCASFAAFTNVLAIKAGLTSYYTFNDDHAWNLVKLDGNYYYIDTTNADVIPNVSKYMIEKYGKGFYYLQDPFHTELSHMSNLDDLPIPKSLLKLIKEANDKKSFIEKYGSNAWINIITIYSVILALIPFIEYMKYKKKMNNIVKGL